jgi:hypothetical protein
MGGWVGGWVSNVTSLLEMNAYASFCLRAAEQDREDRTLSEILYSTVW